MDAKPVAVASRATSKTEQDYPQLDLEGMSVDFGLRRFREYLVGSPLVIKIVTDHKPLVPIFNRRAKGSIRTQRIKLRHQDVPYTLEYIKGKLNQTDYLTRHAKPIVKLSKSEKEESEELNNLLYALHTTPVMDHIGLSTIARETASDEVLKKVVGYVRSGKTWIPKEETEKVKKFLPILPELMVTGNGILIKEDRIVLPEALQQHAIELAHRGAHPGQSGIERRLRFHFFFHEMFNKVQKFVKTCDGCSIFEDKKTKEPIDHHKIPDKCWSTVAVDLFGPMPSSNHVVVVHDLASRFPAAKIVRSTKAESVIPVLSDIYDSYGNPDLQISDNGPPFNSRKMEEFAEQRGIELRHTAPHHPNANPAETCMKTIGKAMKMCGHYKGSEKESLQAAIKGYRQTPHVATGIPPASAMFRDGMKYQFPRKSISAEAADAAKTKDLEQKKDKQAAVNSSKYRKPSLFAVGNSVWIRDADRRSKFQPKFLNERFTVLEVDQTAKKLLLQRDSDNGTLVRHPDDVKPCYSDGSIVNSQSCVGNAEPLIQQESTTNESSMSTTRRRSSRIPVPVKRY